MTSYFPVDAVPKDEAKYAIETKKTKGRVSYTLYDVDILISIHKIGLKISDF